MKHLFTTDVGSHASTNKLFKFLFLILLVIVPMIIVWVVCCQFNEIGLNWMVPVGGKFFINQSMWEHLHHVLNNWSGLPILAHGPTFVNWIPLKVGTNYGDNHNLTPATYSGISQVIPNFGRAPVVLGWPFLIMGLILIVDVLLSLFFLFFTHLAFLDLYPNLFSTWLVMFLMVVGLIMPWNKLGMTIPVTILIMVVGWVLSFIALNALFNQIILRSPYASLYYADLIRQEQVREKMVQPYETGKQKLQGEDLTTVEVEEKIPHSNKKRGKSRKE